MWNSLPSGLKDSLIANFKKKKKVKSKLQIMTQTQQEPKPEPLVPPPVMNIDMNIEQTKQNLNEPLQAPVVMSF